MRQRTLTLSYCLATAIALTSCALDPPAALRRDDARHVAPPVADAAVDSLDALDDDESAATADDDPFSPPYRLDTDTIIQLVFTRSPRVTASREEMIASRYGLEEFRANLSRLEPYAETRADLSDFPNRSGAFGHTIETVVGLEKETFAGAVLRGEAGGSFSRFDFDERDPGQGSIEEGNGVLVRGRLEAPFFGSRRLQNRVIAQAFQESTARKAQLEYLDDYGDYVDDALSYYISTVYYGRLAENYARYAADLGAILDDPRLPEADRGRLESVNLSVESQGNRYRSTEFQYRTILLAALNIDESDECSIERPPYRPSPYARLTDSPEDYERLVDKARKNNPTFTVLADAIRNVKLQRQQAIDGRYDVTTFLEATLFPLGSESFDDRLDGWTVGGGITLRLNDSRVLNATRLKAEAEIRQFRARMDAEEIVMRRRIRTETRGLLDNEEDRRKLLEALEQRREVWRERKSEYFEGKVNVDQLLNARSGLASTETNIAANVYDSDSRERRLLGATGTIYEIVGLRIETESDDSGS